MWRRSGILAVVAALCAAVAWALSLPFPPYFPTSGSEVARHYAFGTFYGWFSTFLFGAFVCGSLSLVLSRGSKGMRGSLFSCLTGVCLGGVFVSGSDSFSDWMNIQLATDGFPRRLLALDWHLLVTAGMMTAVLASLRPSGWRLTYIAMGVLIAAATGYAIRLMYLPFISLARNALNADLASANLPSFLLQNVSMAAVVGAVLGGLEFYGRKAWLRRMLGINEGVDYPLAQGSNRIGSSEGAEVSLRGDANVAPFHALLSHTGDAYCISPTGGPVFLNGRQISSSVVKHGDTIVIGSTALVFMLADAMVHQPSIPASAPWPSPSANERRIR